MPACNRVITFRRFSAFLVMVGLSAAVGGCSTIFPNYNPGALCPGAAALVEASALTGFPPGATDDPSHALYRIAISNVTTDCNIDTHARTADATVDIHFVATRAPNGNAVQYRVPYFVAVRRGPFIQDKKVFRMNFGFAPGQAKTEVDQSIGSTLINIARGQQPYDYQILVGLQLTKEQLQYNRKIGHYGP